MKLAAAPVLLALALAVCQASAQVSEPQHYAGPMDGGNGSLIIQHQPGGGYHVAVAVSSWPGSTFCFGRAAGPATAEPGGTLEMSRTDNRQACRLSVRADGQHASVTELGRCTGEHGASCSFDSQDLRRSP